MCSFLLNTLQAGVSFAGMFVCIRVRARRRGKAADMAANLARTQHATPKHSQLLRPSSVAVLTHFHSKNAHPQLIQVSLRANCASCWLRGRRPRNAEHSGSSASPPYYDAFDKFVMSGFANDFERQVSALFKARWQQLKACEPGAALLSVDNSAR